jgi:hypothetical protein
MTMINVDEGNGVQYKFDPMAQAIYMTDANGKLVKMDLAPSNVHVELTMQTFAQKYSNADMAADKAFPILPVKKASDKYWTLDPINAFGSIDGSAAAAGSGVEEISLELSNNTYTSVPYALGAFIPVEVQSNADVPLNVQIETLEAVLNRFMVRREIRCKNKLFTTASWGSSNYVDLTLDPTKKWNGGAASDPVSVIKTGARACLEYPTHMLMGRETWDVFVQNSQVQKYPAFKSSIAPIPTQMGAKEWCAMLDLPEPIIVNSKYRSTSSSFPYVWANDVVLLKMTGNVGTYSHDTCKTFRWLAAGQDANNSALAGTYNNGIFVRSFFNPYRGTYGGQQIIVGVNDAEVLVSPLNGYYIKGAVQ